MTAGRGSIDAMKSEAAKLAASVAFLERLRADRAAGTEKTQEEYRAEYPGFEDVVDAEYAAVAAPTITDGAPASSSPKPATFGAYGIERELGRGGQGAVYLATDARLGRRVALKLLPPSWAADPLALRRFAQEARALAALDHPGICTVFEASTLDGVPYLAMRYVEGETLAARFAGRSGLPDEAEISAAVRIVEGAARAVHFANEAGFVHRDLKPANIMVQEGDRPVVLDFGLSRSLGSTADLTATGDVLGTPAYMAPEQASGDVASLDRRTDVYSLGVILFQGATGSRPFEGPTAGAVLDAVRQGTAERPRTINRRISADLETVIRTAIATRPVDRYATAADLAEDLRRIAASEPIKARRISWIGQLARWAKRRPAVASLLAAIVLLVPVAGGFAGWYFANRPLVEAQELAIREARAEAALLRGFRHLLAEEPPTDRSGAEAFAEVLRLKPDSDEAIAGLVKAEIVARNFDVATRRIDEFERRNGESPLTRRARAEWLRAVDRTAEAESLLRDLPPPATASECFLEGVRCYALARSTKSNQGQDAAATEWFERAMQRSRRFRRLYLESLAMTVGRTRLEASARRTAETARVMIGGSAGELLAGFALVTVDPEQSVAALKKASEARAGDGPHWTVALVFATAGRDAEAVALLRSVMSGGSDNATAYFNLSILELRTGDLAAGVAAARSAVALRPDLADMHLQLAFALTMSKAPMAEILEAFRRALELAPQDTVIRANYCKTLIAAGRRDEAIAEARKALADRPASAEICQGLGQLLMKTDPRAALDGFRQAMALAPDDAEVVAMAAVACAALNDGPTALRYAAEAQTKASKSPIDPALARQLDRIREVFGGAASRPDEDALDVP